MVRDPRRCDEGVILVNVLAIVAIASAVAVTMLTLSQAAIQRSQRFGDAAQALSTCLGAETSAIVALRRDFETAPQIDHQGEEWASLAESAAPIAGGTFDLSIEDAQSRFNINSLGTGGAVGLENFRAILKAVDLPPQLADGAAALIRLTGPLNDIRDLSRVGLDDATLQKVSRLVTALPERTDVNLNTASQDLLAVLLHNPVSAAFLVSRRGRTGFLTSDDLASANILAVPGVSFNSRYFRVSVAVRIGDVRQTMTSLLYRRQRGSRAEVVVLSRQRGKAAPLQEPPS